MTRPTPLGARAGAALNTPLTPLRFLERAIEVHPDAPAVIDGTRHLTWAQFGAVVTRLAHALRASGVEVGDRVAYLSPNSVEMLAAHYAVPLVHAILVAINTRLAPDEIRDLCDHSGAVLVAGDAALLTPLGRAPGFATVREIVELPAADGSYRDLEGTTRYETLLFRGHDEPVPYEIDDENRIIAINYTSGTTGRPKGVMYTHRGAYLSSLSELHHQRFDRSTRYLWSLPMFHCNGWCHTWAVTASAGAHVCLREVRGEIMWEVIDQHSITHMAGAPIVLATLASASQAHLVRRPLVAAIAGAPPSPTLIDRVRSLGVDLIHVYGLTETYGPYAVCEPKPDWDHLSNDAQANLLARQGVGQLNSAQMRVIRPKKGPAGELIDVAPDGAEMGEIVMRGNCVMAGYYDDPESTSTAFVGGWFHSGDLGVMHPDGYVRLLDRAKDVIISGGENISTIEVEQAVMSHASVANVAVVGIPDDKWGERPKAFVVPVPGTNLTGEDVIAHVRSRIAPYKAPEVVEFVVELPTTSTGKIRKNELREAEWSRSQTRIQG
ncbi:AMP-binding protein [Nocardia sp. NPDC057272]|uniref:AMP-binding protein n=1 Tax=Nocardia sp. NPDC057272 TaxID=3346079 RepID=UPI00362FFAFD